MEGKTPVLLLPLDKAGGLGTPATREEVKDGHFRMATIFPAFLLF